MKDSIHQSVLLQETIDSLDLHTGATVVDATLGAGGHSLEICRRYKGVRIVAFDQDSGAIEQARDKFKGLDCQIDFVNENFRNIDKVLRQGDLNKVDGIIFDLGLSSDQLEHSGRGFSFMRDEPLIMTMKENPRPEDTTAQEVVNTWSEDTLADIIYGYGEEKFAKRIARAIVEARDKSEIKTSGELAEVVRSAIPTRYRRGRIHPATKTFQAIRIAVNDELGALKEGLAKGFELLRAGGRMAVISFHSLEDRIVKRFFKKMEEEGKAKRVNKKIILVSEEEIRNNPRSRSAKLRILSRL